MNWKFRPQAKKDTMLIGFHYQDMSNSGKRDLSNYPVNIYPFFEDYLKYMEEDLLMSSYADFWRWWYVIERYKGDEKGIGELDAIFDECLKRGIKIKVDPAWNTWWSLDEDWETYSNMATGPTDIDDWIHECHLLARRFKGKVSVWDLQGEANDLKGYWHNMGLKFVQDIFRAGYLEFKKIDPNMIIGASGASPSVSLEEMNKWYKDNIDALVGYYDSINMNYFADVADPYEGGLNYYNSIRNMLDEVKAHDVEIGMGETSVQWAETTITAETDHLNMEKQTSSLNEMFGTLMGAGMNKFILWYTEFAPGGGHWPWRWGLRNYEDWWGIWPDSHKVPGTQIIYRYDAPDGKVYDLRQEWPNPANPYYPAWKIFLFWNQIAPRGVDSVRLAFEVGTESSIVWHAAACDKSNGVVTALVYAEQSGRSSLTIELGPTGWNKDAKLIVHLVNDVLNFKTGEKQRIEEKTIVISSKDGKASLEIDEIMGFTTITMKQENCHYEVQIIDVIVPELAEAGGSVECLIVFKNSGKHRLDPSDVRVLETWQAEPGKAWELEGITETGENAMIGVTVQADELAGLQSSSFQFHSSTRGWFGPEFHATWKVVDSFVPRKLVAHRELGRIRLKWFAPNAAGKPLQYYRIYRAKGYGHPMELLCELEATEYFDDKVEMDEAYYYEVAAVYADGSVSRPSNQDNAKSLSKPRYYDAEIMEHNIPSEAIIGQVHNTRVKLRNTGSKTWVFKPDTPIKFNLKATQLWTNQEMKDLPSYAIEQMSENRSSEYEVKHSECVVFEFPLVAPRLGKFENHWIMNMVITGETEADPEAERIVYFGTPLLVETLVK